MKSFKSDNGVVGKLFPSLFRLFQWDQTCRYDKRKGISILDNK